MPVLSAATMLGDVQVLPQVGYEMNFLLRSAF
jgi:hypothetical protein